MVSKKKSATDGYLDIKNLEKLADAMIVLEQKNLKKWTKKRSKAEGFIQPRIERGQDLEELIRSRFQGIGEEALEVAMWVDLYLCTRYLSVGEEYLVLMDTKQAVETLIVYEKNHPEDFELIKEWVDTFGCLLTDGVLSDNSWLDQVFFELLLGSGVLGPIDASEQLPSRGYNPFLAQDD